jgi:pseudouridine-5'-phosphate glycosidase
VIVKVSYSVIYPINPMASSLYFLQHKSTPPLVALESAVITHGLPRPQNLELALAMEQCVREVGATPATIAILDGIIHIGLTHRELVRLANEEPVRKITTVAGTMLAAQQVGIRVFATGGIGGVHNIDSLDISTDLQALADTPMIVVCAGAKAILDLPATLEYLETMSVPVIGFGTDEFPAFYSSKSGLPVSARLDSPQEIVDFSKAHWGIGMKSAVLVCQSLSLKEEFQREKVDAAILQARFESQQEGIRGQALTPFLLARLATLTNGESLRANLALLLNNAKLAAQIAVALHISDNNVL